MKMKKRNLLCNLCLIFMYTSSIQKILATDLTTVEQMNTLLPCTASSDFHWPSVSPILLRWFHSQSHQPVYSLDVRWTNISRYPWNSKGARHFPSPEFEGRIYLELQSHPLSLRIDPVLYRDRGRYTCRIDFRRRRSISSSVDLQVVVPPKRILIRNELGRKVIGAIGPYNVGDRLELHCEVLGGNPIPKLSWSGPLMKTGTLNRSLNGTSSLILPSLSRHHQWTHFSCSAHSESHLTPALMETVTLEINLPPESISIQSNFHEPLHIGQQLELSCKSIGSHPRAHIHWYSSDGSIIQSKEVMTDNGNVTISYFHKNVTEEDDGKSLECRITNPMIPEFSAIRTHLLRVLHKPRITIHIVNNHHSSYPFFNHSTVERDNITIHCSISANPSVYRLMWLFNNTNFHKTSTAYTKADAIVINNVDRNHMGLYTCNAVNSQGESSQSIFLSVKYRPVCSHITISPIDDDTVNVTCHLYANPSDLLTFRWLVKQGLTNHSSWVSDKHPWTTLKLKENIELFCWGINEMGRQHEPCRITLNQDVYEDRLGTLYSKDILMIICCSAILCLIVMMCLHNKNAFREKYSSTTNIFRSKDNDPSCKRLMNNCVNCSITNENEIVSLLPEAPIIEKELLESSGFRYVKRSESEYKSRRIQSSLF